jgi:hypothetical protein
LREVVATLDPAHEWGTTCAISPPPPPASVPPAEDLTVRQATPEALGGAESRG